VQSSPSRCDWTSGISTRSFQTARSGSATARGLACGDVRPFRGPPAAKSFPMARCELSPAWVGRSGASLDWKMVNGCGKARMDSMPGGNRPVEASMPRWPRMIGCGCDGTAWPPRRLSQGLTAANPGGRAEAPFPAALGMWSICESTRRGRACLSGNLPGAGRTRLNRAWCGYGGGADGNCLCYWRTAPASAAVMRRFPRRARGSGPPMAVL
jgi:hypothetical protein